MSWNYAELSKMAKENGGPEALVEKLIQSGIEQGISEGKESMVPVVVGAIGLALAAGAGITVGVQKLIKWVSKKKENPEEIEAVKTELINGIREYDEANPDTEDNGGEDNE